MVRRIDPSRDTLILKNINELDPATELSTGDKLIVYQGSASRSATLDDVFGQFASSEELTEFQDIVTDQLSQAVLLNNTQTITGAKTFTLAVVVPTPTNNNEAANKEYVDDSILAAVGNLDGVAVKTVGDQTIAGVKTFTSVPVLPASDPTTNNQATRKAYVDTLDAQNVKITGTQNIGGAKTFTGTIAVPEPTLSAQAANKFYVDTLLNTTVKLTGDESIAGVKTFTSIPLLPSTNPTNNNEAARKAYVDGLDATSVKTTGNQSIAGTKTFTGTVIVPEPTGTNHAVSKFYVDIFDGQNVKITGAQDIAGVKTFTSIPELPASNPTTANQATRKSYVDGLDAANVKLTGVQDITGNKTFSGTVTFSGSLTVPTATTASQPVTKAQLDAVSSATPIGAMMIWPGSVAPTAYLLCQGQAISRTTYSALFTLLGTTYGTGDGSTTFNLPDMRNRVPVGTGEDGALGAVVSSNNKIVPLPEHNHTLSIDAGGSHSHSATISTAPNHTHNIGYQGIQVQSGTGIVVTQFVATNAATQVNTGLNGDHSHTATIGTNGSHTHTASINNAGSSGASLDVRQKSLYLNYIIYTGVV